jgi:hypothetical protein
MNDFIFFFFFLYFHAFQVCFYVNRNVISELEKHPQKHWKTYILFILACCLLLLFSLEDFSPQFGYSSRECVGVCVSDMLQTCFFNHFYVLSCSRRKHKLHNLERSERMIKLNFPTQKMSPKKLAERTLR